MRRESARRLKGRRFAESVVARRSQAALWFFDRVFEKTLVRDFHALRILRGSDTLPGQAQRIVVYSNHPSWWEGILYLLLARRLFKTYRAFTPIDARMLERYPLLTRLGAFGVDQNSPKGAADFIETCKVVLHDPGGLLLIAAQGRFSDVRERPLRLSPGLAHLADLAEGTVFVPLAIETTFWIEKRPELLIAFGPPVKADEIRDRSRTEQLPFLELRLAETMDRLCGASIARKSADFDVLIEGRSEINVVYDLWRRLAAFARGQMSFRPGHGSSET